MGRMRKTTNVPVGSFKQLTTNKVQVWCLMSFSVYKVWWGFTSQQAKRSSFNRSKHL